MSKRLVVVLVLSLLLVGCFGGPDLRPSMEKVKKSLEAFEPDLVEFWESDAFMEDDRPSGLTDEEWTEEKEEAVKERKAHWAQLKQTVDVALDPSKERKDEHVEDRGDE